MASVRKRKWTHNGVDREAWIVNYTDQAGKRRLKTFDKKKDADKFRTQVEVEIERGVHVPDRETFTVRYAAEQMLIDFEKRVKIGDFTKASLHNLESKLRIHIVPRFGGVLLTELKAADIQDWVDDLRLRYKANSVADIYKYLFQLLSFAVRRKFLVVNPLRDEPCRVPVRPKRAAVPSRSDIDALLTASLLREKDESLITFLNRRLVVLLGLFSTFRPGESYGLQWQSVDLDRRVLRVRNSFSAHDGLKGPKTAAGLRDVPMAEPVHAWLLEIARYYAARKAAHCPKGHYRPYRFRLLWARRENLQLEPLSGYVIVNKVGGPQRAPQCSTFWPRLMKKAGLYDEAAKKSKFTPHALRHASASLLIDAGLPHLQLKSVMGHASVATTFDVYGHLFPEDRQTLSAVSSIAGQFCATTERQGAVSH